LQSKTEGPNLSEANERLENQLQQLTDENHKLKSNVESIQQRLQSDLSEKKQEIGKIQKMHEAELNKLNVELRKTQKEVEVKDAALQSLKLARPVRVCFS
jgi:predicted RNase H-like nuclease (RuvC/YqgF family)